MAILSFWLYLTGRAFWLTAAQMHELTTAQTGRIQI